MTHTPLENKKELEQRLLDERRLNLELQLEISKRKRLESRLRENEQRARALLNAITESALMINGSGVVIEANKTIAKRLNTNKKELIGTCLWDFLPEEITQNYKKQLDIVIKTGEPVHIKEQYNGRFFETTIWPSFDSGNSLTAFAIFSRDITKRLDAQTQVKAAEEMAKKQHEKLYHAAKMVSLGTLVSGMAHEINNPNTFIMGNTPMIQKIWKHVSPVLEEHCRKDGDIPIGNIYYSEIHDTVPQLLDGILDGAKRVNKIVQNLKNFARKNPDKNFILIAPNEAVKTSLTFLDSMIKKSTCNFSVKYSNDLPLIMGDSQSIEQVIINLVINACQALTAKTQRISISTSFDTRSGCVIVKVQDEGCGIPVDILPRITDPFFTTKRNSKGTGIGLSITSRIVSEHGGTILFTSSGGKGTTATVMLPAVEESPEPKVSS